MKEIVGTSNRVLEVDLTRRAAREIAVSPRDRRLYLGGKGLGLRLLYDRLVPGADPLGPDNWLAFMPGVLMGTGAPCSGRFSALTKSPLTGIMLHCSCGGPFGMALKTAGWDGLLVGGSAAEPVFLEIDARGATFRSAADLWGLDTAKTQQSLAPGRRDGVLAIGPAGENRVRFANVAAGHRFLGRGGMGAVLGAKNLKALLARGGVCKIVPADPRRFARAKKRAVAYINRNAFTAKAYRRYGTASHVRWCNRAGILPVRNFQDGSHPDADRVAGETMADRYRPRPHTCRPCTILCGHRGTWPDGTKHAVPEYESLGLLGPNLGIFDPDRISAWNERCGELGLDTISTGAVLAWTMEAGERGLVDTGLRFGDPSGVDAALEDVAARRGFGDRMAAGTRRLSADHGGEDFAIHVKGLEMAAYDPRGCWGQGLSYAVANRGGCHLSSATFALETGLRLLNPHTARAKARFVHFFEKLYAAVNSLHTCQFTAYAYVLEPPLVRFTPRFVLAPLMQYLPSLALRLMDLSVFSRLYGGVTGQRISQWRMLAAGDRVHTLERYMNTREGIRRKDDTLPGRMLREGRGDDPHGRTVPLARMLDDYYRLRGYGADGVPTRRTLQRLKIPPPAGERGSAGRDRTRLRVVTPGGRPLQRAYLAVMLWFFGRAIQAAARVDADLRAEFAALPARFSFSLEVRPAGPAMVVGKDEKGRVRYLGHRTAGRSIDLRLLIRNAASAMQMFTFREATAVAVARDRIVADGDILPGCAVIRIMDRVEVYLLPRFLARRAVKRYPKLPPLRKHLGRLMIYLRAVTGI